MPAVAFDFPAALPWVGLAAALIVSMGAANLYGDDGTGLWLTRMVPGVERADVRGRQAAWLLVVAPAALALTAALTVLGGQGWAWPWLLAVLPAVLGGTAGLMMVVSVARPVRQKDPHRRSGPFDTGDDPNAAGALIGPPLSRARSAARDVLLTAGILLIVPQGLVPIGFNLFGVDPQVRVWFAARYLPQQLQVPVAAALVAAGVLALWWAARIGRPGRRS